MFDIGGSFTMYPESHKRYQELSEIVIVRSLEYPESNYFNVLMDGNTILYNVTIHTGMTFIDGFWYGKRSV